MGQAINNTLKLITSLLIAVIAVSCVSTKTLNIEIPKPAPNNLPENIQSLTIVNRTVDGKYEDHNSDSLQNIFYSNQFKLDTVIYDLQAVDTLLKALGELLFESGRYDFVIPANRFLEFRSNSFLNVEMSWDEVKELCEQYNTDAILSIDHYKVGVKTNIGQESYYNPLSGGFSTAIIAQMQVDYEVMFRIYDPVNEKVILREFQRDTLFWEDADATTRDLFRHFPSVKQALLETSIVIALDFSEKISTNWHEEQRNFFIKGKPVFEQAGNLASNGEWLQAIALWKQILETSKSKSEKSKAEFNIAVGYEILGDLDQAVSWALKSYNTMFRTLTYDYLDKLQKRKNELKN
jgi:tetratricopeptide (TPR) repeat protein